MRWFLAELLRRDRVLAIAGGEFVALLVVMLVAAAIDDRTVLGINVWIKPIKFATVAFGVVAQAIEGQRL